MRKPSCKLIGVFLSFLTIAIAGQGCPEDDFLSPQPLVVHINPQQVSIFDTEDFAYILVEVEGAEPDDQFWYEWQLPANALGQIEQEDGAILDALGTDQASVKYVLFDHSQQQAIKTETLFVNVLRINEDGSLGDQVGTDQTQVTIYPAQCDGSEGTPVFNGCGTATTSSSVVAMGEQLTITFKQQAGGICGGTWTIDMNMPGQFVSAPGGTISTQSVSFPDPGAETTRTAVYQLGANGFDYEGLRTCPRALGYYEFPSDDTGPYIYVTNGAAHDLVPFIVDPPADN